VCSGLNQRAVVIDLLAGLLKVLCVANNYCWLNLTSFRELRFMFTESKSGDAAGKWDKTDLDTEREDSEEVCWRYLRRELS